MFFCLFCIFIVCLKGAYFADYNTRTYILADMYAGRHKRIYVLQDI